MPFLAHYPYDEHNFRFIGTPIDGVQFEEDKIIFVEFKIGQSQLTSKQRHIRDLIYNQKIEFKEMRLK